MNSYFWESWLSWQNWHTSFRRYVSFVLTNLTYLLLIQTKLIQDLHCTEMAVKHLLILLHPHTIKSTSCPYLRWSSNLSISLCTTSSSSDWTVYTHLSASDIMSPTSLIIAFPWGWDTTSASGEVSPHGYCWVSRTVPTYMGLVMALYTAQPGCLKNY